MKIGFPRAMSFYENYPFFYGFFKALGIEIVLSDRTTKKTMSEGSALVVTETCLPIKIFVGHVLNLLEKGIDKIFVPSIQSIEPKIYNCSKIRGLPDLIRNVIKKPFTIVEATFDKSEEQHGFYDFLQEIVSYFGIFDKNKIKAASKEGFKVYNNFKIMTNSGVPYKKALKYAFEGKICLSNESDKEIEHPISVALVSHPYNIYDERASMKIFDKLEKMGVKVYSALNLTKEQMTEGLNALDLRVYWANELEMSGCSGYYMREPHIDGIITITAFGCGPDSLMLERIQRKSRQFDKPMLNLTIDEHTGEAGFITRLEAFIDMLYRKKRMLMLTNADENEIYKPKIKYIELSK